MKTLLLLSFALSAVPLLGVPEEYFAIEVVDGETGRGVPLVELRTVDSVGYWTDSAGRVAFLEPGLMGDLVFFAVHADGYEYPKDGFGYRGFRVQVETGETHRVELKRTNIAERLYRLTGAGVYRDSVLLGLQTPREEPVLNGRVLGQDSALAIPYRGKTFWVWGDTSQPSYPLGNFQVAMATAGLPSELEPERTIDFTYFVDEDGFARPMAVVPGEGPTWLGGMTVLTEEGKETLVAGYAKVDGKMVAHERGVVVYEDSEERFVPEVVFPKEAALYPIGHALTIGEGEDAWVYFCNPLPLVRVRANLEAMANPGMYEAFTPLVAGSRRASQAVERDAEGRVVWGWKKDTAEVSPVQQMALVEAEKLRDEERMVALKDWRTGKEIRLHGGAVNWNEYRQRWVLVVSEIWGSSTLGEVWFAEADSPLGPWCYGVKVVSHEKYTFYNPRHHRFLDRDGGRTIFFEGTYSAMFSDVKRPTPRYDYNQILYRLDVTDSRMDLPVAFYRRADGGVGSAAGEAKVSGRPLFWAWEKPGAGRIGVECVVEAGALCRFKEAGEEAAVFYLVKVGEDLETGEAFFEEDGRRVELPGIALPHPLGEGPVLVPMSGE